MGSLKLMGHFPLNPMLLQEIRAQNWKLRHVGLPVMSSLRARLGRDFVFPDYMSQRAAFLAGKPSTEPASLLSRDRDYEHARPVSLADKVKDALHVGHTDEVRSEQKSRGIFSSLKGLGGGIVASIKHKLGLDKPRIDASFFVPTETEVNYSASGGFVDNMKSTASTVKDTVAGGLEIAKDKLVVAKDVISDKLGLSGSSPPTAPLVTDSSPVSTTTLTKEEVTVVKKPDSSQFRLSGM